MRILYLYYYAWIHVYLFSQQLIDRWWHQSTQRDSKLDVSLPVATSPSHHQNWVAEAAIEEMTDEDNVVGNAEMLSLNQK